MSSETEYRVLARKYRPKDFSDLVGQNPMVRTLTNAFSSGRIAQAWMLTGVRGVGKTTTARILARALNYQKDGIDQPTIDIQELGEHCQAIMDGRHVDVVEMDAASHTGIDDIREIIEQVRYKPISARYKIYIIDEVHMLSTQAFNGLLKTLEEPPEHVKFIFATTEIRKVPITVLSRCQRFDLRRIDASDLSGHFKMIAGKEGVEIDDESLALISRAAEGSARDGLSLMDQAIAHGSGKVEAEAVRSMLGLADRTRIADLFDFLMKGEIAKALEEFKAQYDAGANPLVVLTDLADFTHTVTRLKYAPAAKDDTALTEVERTRGAEFGKVLSTPILSRTWQMLLKAISETTASNRPFASAEMALIRIAHSAHLPSPEDLAKIVTASEQSQTNGGAPVPAGYGSNGGAVQSAKTTPQSSEPQSNQNSGDAPTVMLANGTNDSRGIMLHAIDNPNPQPLVVSEPELPSVKIESLEDLVALADQHRDVTTKIQIRNHVRLVSIEPGRLEISLTEQGSPTLPGELIDKLKKWTGVKWIVGLNRDAGGPTLAELESEKQEALVTDAREDKDVAAILKKYPGARITNVRIAIQDDDFHFSETEDGDISPDSIDDNTDLPE
ncbi:DNA polymerase III subunit gamma/tau [Lentilitoribacter sp. EG35]|uniref:DNA polymerase III subunit gamma/tau n=1 Tax=Lentilitoribacter sp. EG35 TaxID=3234192 RepID=UPI00345FB9A8